MGDMVRRQGIDLPLPFGVSMAYRNQDMNIPFNDFTIDGVRLNDLFDPEDTVGIVNAESFSIRGDVNILPFGTCLVTSAKSMSMQTWMRDTQAKVASI